MKRITQVAFSAFLFFTLFNGTLVQNASITGNSLPDVNFAGTITDVDDKKYDVEHITISGMYKNIHVFPKPKDPQNFSTRNYEKIDLAEIKNIKPNHAVKFKHRGIEYIELNVTRNDGGVDTYMIKGRKSVQATREPKSGSIAKILDINQLKSLNITGYTQKKEKEDEKKKTIVKGQEAPGQKIAEAPAS